MDFDPVDPRPCDVPLDLVAMLTDVAQRVA
jgi:hypothetical protein